VTNTPRLFNLHLLRVLVTRPKPQGFALCQRIEANQGHAIYLPTIEIQPPQDISVFRQGLARIDQQDWLIFVSPQAVYACAGVIVPPQVKIAAVGKGTAQALHAAQWPVVVYPVSDWSSEGLLAIPEFQVVAGKKITIVCGEGGRELLANTLTARGAWVSLLIAYRRALPEIDVNYYLHLLEERQLDAVVCTSGEGLKNLQTLLGEAAQPYLLSLPLVVVSERMQALAQSVGFKIIVLAKNASHEAILEALATIRKQVCPTR